MLSALTARSQRARRPLRRRGARPILLEQISDALGGLCALCQPVLDAREVDAEPGLAAGRDRVEETDALDVASVARAAPVRHDDVIERTFGRAAARQPSDHHTEQPQVAKTARRPRGPPL